LSLAFGHQELLSVLLILFLNLHLANKIVLVFDLILYLCEILGDGAKVFLLKVVFLFSLRELWCGKDILNCVGNNKILITDKTVDWFLIVLWNCGLRSVVTFKFLD